MSTPLLAVWRRDNHLVVPTGAENFRRDIPDAEISLFDTGHFALETRAKETGGAMREFLASLVRCPC